MITIKVQLIGHKTAKSLIESGFADAEHPLTFHAYSDTMKARILESLLKPENVGKIAISFTNELPRDGEWHEPLVSNCIINHSNAHSVNAARDAYDAARAVARA